MRASEFESIVEQALANIPEEFRARLDNVSITVEDEPTPATLEARGVALGGTLLGLYEGRPLTVRSSFDTFSLPDRITIFQGPHERLARNREHLERLVEQTVWHEIAHYLGMDEDHVRAAERTRHAHHLWPH
ncbi:MAG: metallopeptidase family protein [Acidobacteria bacterium]|nr:MAG: metallopeptidase family protein [Acidobacteriota bacterium]